VRIDRAEKLTIRGDFAWDAGDDAADAPPPSSPLALHEVPKVLISASEVLALRVDSRTGFVLSLVDGRTTVEAIADIAALAQEETLAVLERLRALGAVGRSPLSEKAAKQQR
jgi:hypothetical protein